MKYIKLFENYLEDKYYSTLKDIYSRVDTNEFNKWIDANSLEGEINATDITEELLDEVSFFLGSEKAIEVDENGYVEFYKLWEDAENLIGNNIVKLYHFTSDRFLESIKQNGLEIGHNKTNSDGNSYSGIYLTTRTSGKEIDGYKYHIRKYGNPVLITIRTKLSLIEADVDDYDIESGETQFVIDRVDYKDIIDIDTDIY
jgi:hypothetical protein